MFLCYNSKKTISLALFLLLSIQAFSQFLNKNIEAKLTSNQTNNTTTITASAINKTSSTQGLSYKLTVFKTDQNGNKSNNQQNGQLDLFANQTRALSSTSINVAEKNRIIILLLIYDINNKLIAKDRIVLNDEAKDDTEAKINDIKLRQKISELFEAKKESENLEEEINEVEAKIEINQKNEYLSIAATSYNKTDIDKSLKYKLVVSKIDESENNILHQQNQRFLLSANTKKELISKNFNKADNIKIIISLSIYNEDDEIVGSDRVVLNQDGSVDLKQKNTVQLQQKTSNPDIGKSGNDGSEIRGIVVEDTKTKPGRDFYKLFYNSYARNKINANQIVTVKEILAIGRNTKIEVIVGYETIFSFFVRPSSEYLNKMNSYAITRMYKHLKKQERDSKTIKRY